MMAIQKNACNSALAACSLFKGLKTAEIESLAELCEIRHVEKGQQIFSEGNLAQAFYVLASGRVRIFKLAASGREQTLITPEPPMSFAEAALFADQRYPAYCAALEDSDIVVINKASFIKFIESRPQIALNMIALMAERLRGFARKIEQLSLMGVVPRLAEYLIQQSDGKNEFAFDISKSDLASLLGTVPETLSRALGKLKSGGIISEIGPRVIIMDREALQEIATSGE
jgi:CRP/FNR family transcriptional regulator, dissimilatory nitrate respiration regulator